MVKFVPARVLGFLPSLLAMTFTTTLVLATNRPSFAQSRVYSPIPFQAGSELRDRLTSQDIPTGEGGFARDYLVNLEAGDHIVIDLLSDEFDTIVMLMDMNGRTIAENDDGPDGTTNSLLFTRITQSGSYIVRVRAFGETLGGAFTLKVTRLRPI